MIADGGASLPRDVRDEAFRVVLERCLERSRELSRQYERCSEVVLEDVMPSVLATDGVDLSGVTLWFLSLVRGLMSTDCGVDGAFDEKRSGCVVIGADGLVSILSYMLFLIGIGHDDLVSHVTESNDLFDAVSVCKSAYENTGQVPGSPMEVMESLRSFRREVEAFGRGTGGA